jgi:putative ABC transport system substrate-binding protein
VRRWAWLLLWLLPLMAAGQGRPRVVVVKSADLAAYAAVVAGFSAEVRGEVEEVLLPEDPEAAAKVLQASRGRKPALVLAVGPLAANAARGTFTDVPILFTMVPYYERYGLEGPNVTGISLTGDFSHELSALRALVPTVKRVGVLHDARYSQALMEAAQAAAQAQGMSVVSLEADSAQRAERVLSGAAQKVDTLLMVADKTVGSADVVRLLIRTSREAKLPLVGLSSSQVKEGALLSLSPSYLGIGQQAGRLANRVVHEKVDPGALAVARPEVLEMSLNLTTARQLGDSRVLTDGLLRYVAQQGFPLKVSE